MSVTFRQKAFRFLMYIILLLPIQIDKQNVEYNIVDEI